jgi:hypothetical protein
LGWSGYWASRGREREGVGAQKKKEGFSILLKWLRGKEKRD